MSKRPVYTPKLTKPYYKAEMTEFDWKPGLAAAIKTKNSQTLHEAYLAKHPDAKLLEVTTKSPHEIGQSLSPFNLKKTIRSLKKDFPVENIYHASKVFSHGGPYIDLLGTSPLESKRDERLNNSGELVHFQLEDQKYPVSPDILFFNWLYIQALMENPGISRHLKDYNAFTDIEFAPAPGKTNNQARACAIYCSLRDLGLLDQAKTFEGFKKLFLIDDITEIKEQVSAPKEAPTMDEMRKTVVKRTPFSVGTWISHPGIGKGQIMKKTRDAYLIKFNVAGPRTISKEFVETKCKAV